MINIHFKDILRKIPALKVLNKDPVVIIIKRRD
jgi:hypothetical protein